MNHFLTDDNETIYVHVSGEGPALVFLHGWTSSHVAWNMFLRNLNPDFRSYRWDARAHGGHALQTSTPVTVSRMARDLQNMLDHVNIEQATIIGHSMGALTLWQYIHDFGTARINKLCFIDQSPKLLTDDTWKLGIYGSFDAIRAEQFVEHLQKDFAETVLQLIACSLNAKARQDYLANIPAWQATRENFQTLAAKPLIECWKSLTEADYRPLLEKIDRPTLLLYGCESNYYTAETSQYVANAIPNSILKIYPGEDHSPHMWQRERFLTDLRAFLA